MSDGVVARCAGRMEFGARALGNRSILATATLGGTLINKRQNRDFWMPFRASILRSARAIRDNPRASPSVMM